MKAYTNLKAVKLKNFEISVLHGHSMTLDGFALLDLASGELVTFDRVKPYVLERKKDIQSIVESGLIGRPEIYKSTDEQKAAIV